MGEQLRTMGISTCKAEGFTERSGGRCQRATPVASAPQPVDETPLVALVNECQSQMVRIAQRYVDDPEIAQEVVQETWLAAMRGLHAFAGRAALKSWIFAILLNQARTRGKQEKRRRLLLVDTAALAEDEETGLQANWTRAIVTSPEAQLIGEEGYRYLEQAIAALPTQQRLVIALADLEGRSPAEICHQLKISEANQRVLLHRARQQVRLALQADWAG